MAKKLVFDSTDVDSLAASDFVGSHLYASNVQLTRTTIVGKEALDVNVANDIMVDLNGIYDNPDNLLPDNVGLIGNTRAAAPDETGQVERITVGAASSDNVVAANVHAIDSNAFNMVFDGTTWDRLLGTAGALHIHDGGNVISIDDAGGSITVDGTVAVSGTVTVSDAALANTAVDNGEEDIDDTAGGIKVITTDLTNRKYAYLFNFGSHEAYLGKTSGLTTANGFPIYPGVYLDIRMGAAIALYGICKTGKTTNIRNLQLS